MRNFSQKTVEANEQEKAQLCHEKRSLKTEKDALHLKLESDAALAAERERQSTLAKEKAQKLQSENGQLRETIADRERDSLTLNERIKRLKSDLRDT